MAFTGLDTFDQTIEKSNLILKEIGEGLGNAEDRDKAYSALRAVLHTLRDRLTVEEASDLAAQLPIMAKGVFYDGWNPSLTPKKIDKEEFIREIRESFPYPVEISTEEVVRVVMGSLKGYISFGEAEDVISVLPSDIAQMLGPMMRVQT
jgi:uncharacterized protein (DUF2267 family)